MQPDERAAPVRGLEVLEPLDRPRRPGGERAADLGLERAVAAEDGGGLRVVLAGVEALRAVELARLAVVAVAERERQRRVAAARLGGGRNVASGRHHAEHDDTRRGQRREGDERHDPAARIHRATIAVALSATPRPAIQLEAMSSYRELLQEAKASIEEVDARRAQELLDGEDAPLLVDVRERDEWEQGRIPDAVHVPRGHLESRIEGVAPDRSRPVLLYCSPGNRSAFAAKTLSELGYERNDLARRRLHGLAAQRPPDRPAALARARARDPLQPPPADPGGRRGGAAAAARLAHPADRRGRARLAGLALPGRGRRRQARDRRRGRGRRDEPAAPDRALDQLARRAEDRLGAPARSRP